MSVRIAMAGALMAGAGLIACACGSGASDPADDDVSGDLVTRLDQEWADYQSQKALFAEGRFPLDTPAVTFDCPAGASCDPFRGYNIGRAFYARWGTVELAAEVGPTPVASVPDGDVYALDGVEPAVYLMLDTAEGWEGLRAIPLPSATTSAERAIELRDDTCSVRGAVTGADLTVGDCDGQTMTWVVGSASDRWPVDDPIACPIPPSAGWNRGPGSAEQSPMHCEQAPRPSSSGGVGSTGAARRLDRSTRRRTQRPSISPATAPRPSHPSRAGPVTASRPALRREWR